MTTANQWIVDRLEDWAQWSLDCSGAASGYPSKCPWVEERLENSLAPIAISPEIELTDRAVALVRLEKKWKWRVIQRRYLARMVELEMAMDFCRPLNVMRQMIWAAESAVGRHVIQLERLAIVQKKDKYTQVRRIAAPKIWATS